MFVSNDHHYTTTTTTTTTTYTMPLSFLPSSCTGQIYYNICTYCH